MTRNFKLAFLASAALTASGCVGAYQAPGGGNGNGANAGGTGTAGGGGTGAAGGTGVAGGGGSAGGTGAAGGGGTTTPPPSNAKSLFDANVAPIVMADCATSGCHANAAVTNPPPFATGTQANLYATILNYADVLFPNFEPTTAPILTKIAAGHSGVAYSATDISNITGWLNGEKTARAGSTTSSPRELLLEKFSGCMTLADFTSAGVATAWANKTTNTTNTACQQCHVNASYFLANADSTRMFNILSTAANPQGGWFMEYFFTVDTTDPANLKMAINRDYINQAATGVAQHEKFDIDTDKNGGNPSAYTRLTTFFNAAQAKMTAGTCGPSTLGTTPP
jgi:hypothetical protein